MDSERGLTGRIGLGFGTMAAGNSWIRVRICRSVVIHGLHCQALPTMNALYQQSTHERRLRFECEIHDPSKKGKAVRLAHQSESEVDQITLFGIETYETPPWLPLHNIFLVGPLLYNRNLSKLSHRKLPRLTALPSDTVNKRASGIIVKRSARLNPGRKNTQNRYHRKLPRLTALSSDTVNKRASGIIPDKYSSMRNRPSRDKIRFLLETEQDMYLNEQELDQWIQEKNQEAEEEIKLILQKRSANTISAIPLNSVEVKDEEYMSDYEESEGELEVSQSEPEIVMAQTYEEEAEKEIEVTLTRPEKLQQESKDNQSFVLVNPPTLPYIFDDFEMEVDVKERSKTFCTAGTFMLDDLKIINSYVLEVPDKLPFLNKGVSVSLPNARGESIILRYSLLEGFT
ncbi:hypothetical protein Sjap_012071 [Stephania japonica]|uniref:Uncharacterized protein n=1 Tax=Stephania japonica TaxID=461633 RepID=A0AAP0NXX8_9MAGN